MEATAQTAVTTARRWRLAGGLPALLAAGVLAAAVGGCGRSGEASAAVPAPAPPPALPAAVPAAVPAAAPAETAPGVALARTAAAQVGVTLLYDPAYRRIDYPGGDVPADRGVCTDVVVRAFRALGVDLQREVHEDMRRSFAAYPQLWDLTGPDRNIDHRRVPNLMRWLERRGKGLPTGAQALPGDVIAWRLPNGLLHVGIVAEELTRPGGHHLVVHNIGAGARREDVLFAFERIGHYRW